jgi:hypothetical protein
LAWTNTPAYFAAEKSLIFFGTSCQSFKTFSLPVTLWQNKLERLSRQILSSLVNIL